MWTLSKLAILLSITCAEASEVRRNTGAKLIHEFYESKLNNLNENIHS